MNSSRIAFIAAVTAVVQLGTLKAVAIGTAGGLGRSPFEGPLFFAGLISFVVASVAVGVALTRGRPRVGPVVTGVVVAPVVGIGFTMAIDTLVGALQPASPLRHWVWTEVNLWAVALAVLALTHAVRGREATPRSA